MKISKNNTTMFSWFRTILFSLCMTVAMVLPSSGNSYDAKLELSYEKSPGGNRILKAKVQAKKGDESIPVKNIIVNFYMDSIGGEGGLGNATTNDEGLAKQILEPGRKITMDSSGQITFIAQTEHNAFGLLKDQIKVTDALIKLSTNAEDTTIQAQVFRVTPEKKIPVEQAKVNFFVNRYFGKIPIGGSFTYTNSEGKVSIDFPVDIPGDSAGKVEVLAYIEDHEDFGNVGETVQAPWGNNAFHKNTFDQRSLWAGRASAPWWLIIVANLIILGIWGTIIYVATLINKIKKA